EKLRKLRCLGGGGPPGIKPGTRRFKAKQSPASADIRRQAVEFFGDRRPASRARADRIGGSPASRYQREPGRCSASAALSSRTVLALCVALQATRSKFRSAIGATYDTPYSVLSAGVTKYSCANRASGERCVSVTPTQ